MDGALQQRTVDRIAVAGIAVTLAVAAAWVALDPIQVVSRPALDPRRAPAPVAASAPAVVPVSAPLRYLPLPAETWQVVSDGTFAAYPRVTETGANEIVLGRLSGGAWRVIHRSGERRVLGQLSLAGGVLAFEEFDSGTNEPTVSVRALRLADERWVVVDEYAIPQPEGTGNGRTLTSAAPLTDGRRIFWMRGSEVRQLDLASGEERAVARVNGSVPALFAWRDTLAFSLLRDGEPARAMTIDLASGALRAIDGFSYAFVEAVGPSGVALLGSESERAPLATWLVGKDGERTRLGSDCLAAMSGRVLALRCGGQLTVRDLATGRTLTERGAQLGLPAVFDRGAVWSEGAELAVYELPSLPSDDMLSPQ